MVSGVAGRGQIGVAGRTARASTVLGRKLGRRAGMSARLGIHLLDGRRRLWQQLTDLHGARIRLPACDMPFSVCAHMGLHDSNVYPLSLS